MVTPRSRLVRSTAFVAVILLALISGAPTAEGQGAGKPADPAAGSDYVIVTFTSPPAASYTGGVAGISRTKPERGRLDTESPAYRAYQRHLQNEHGLFRAFVKSRAPQVQVVREYFTVLNGMALKMNGAALGALAGGPGVRAIAPSALYRPTMNVSTHLIRADAVWGSLGGQATAGAGIRVAVIDSGIDASHPFLSDAGLAAQPRIDECGDQDGKPATPNTTNKVIVCRVFYSGSAVVPPINGPALCVDHGTHVAGTIGGRAGTSGPVAETDVVLTDLSGVAPGVLLGNYNVFPCFGGGFIAFDGSAFSHDLVEALEAALLDGMDIANMSLSGSVQGPNDFLAEAANAAVDAGMVVVAAVGNSGPGSFTVGSPASAAKVIGAGASSNPHFVGIPVQLTAGPLTGSTIGAVVGDFENFDPPISAAYTTTTPADGCTAITNTVSGRIALIDRGACSFTTKVRNAQSAGAVGVLIVNSVAGDPIPMADDDTLPFPTIPAAMVGKKEGAAMKPSGALTVDGTTFQEILSTNADIIGDFSSRGPTPFTYEIKPDLTGPGVNVASSVFGGEFAFFDGTSMATPHLSGVAALLLDRFPGASPAEVKSRMANNAARVVTDHVNGTVDPGVMARGGGRVDVVEAFNAATWFDPVSVSFGLVQGRRPFNETRIVAVEGAPATSASVAFSGTAPAGLLLTAVIVAGDLSVNLSLDRTVPNGVYTGDIVVAAAGQSYRIPFWVAVANR
jgi:minor extracellular serine protease Vpr